MEDEEIKYKATGLKTNGFVLEKVEIKSTTDFKEELCNLNNDKSARGISFHRMREEKQKRSKGKARNMPTPSKKRTPSQTIEKNLPGVAQCSIWILCRGSLKTEFLQKQEKLSP